MQKLVIGIRWIYSIFYILIGLQTLSVLIGFSSKPDFSLSPENAAFQNALDATGFIVPIMAIAYIASGTLMLFRRTAPLGIVILAPLVVVILFTHVMLNGNPIWGVIHASLLLWFAWQFREAYVPLWSQRTDEYNK